MVRKQKGSGLLFSNGGNGLTMEDIYGPLPTQTPGMTAGYAVITQGGKGRGNAKGKRMRGGGETASFGELAEGTTDGGVGRFEFTNIRWWLPSWQEFLIFIIAAGLTYWLITIYQYNVIENKVVQTSRCYKSNHALKDGTVQYVTATNARNSPLYTVSYNIPAKQTTIDCACKSGTTVNTFTNIPIYDFTANNVSILTEKQCQCDTPLLASSPNVYYTGYPDLVRFMNTASVSSNPQNDPNVDTTFFTSYTGH
jgi:hypothetical protein